MQGRDEHGGWGEGRGKKERLEGEGPASKEVRK